MGSMLAYMTDKGDLEKKDKCEMCLHAPVLSSAVPGWVGTLTARGSEHAVESVGAEFKC